MAVVRSTLPGTPSEAPDRGPGQARRRARREARARLLRLPSHERQHRAAAVEARKERAAPSPMLRRMTRPVFGSGRDALNRMVLRSLLARWKSRASIAAEVSLPVWLVCDPRRGRHMLPVSTRYASAAVSRMVSNASRRLPRFCARSVTSSVSGAGCPPEFQLDAGSKFQGRSSRMRDCGWPAAIFSSVFVSQA